MSSRWRVRAPSTPEPAGLNGAAAPPWLTVEAATSVACEKANARAKELYGCEPFAEAPLARFTSGHYTWFTRQPHGHGDIEATVEFAADGSVKEVEVVLMLNKPAQFF